MSFSSKRFGIGFERIAFKVGRYKVVLKIEFPVLQHFDLLLIEVPDYNAMENSYQ